MNLQNTIKNIVNKILNIKTINDENKINNMLNKILNNQKEVINIHNQIMILKIQIQSKVLLNDQYLKSRMNHLEINMKDLLKDNIYLKNEIKMEEEKIKKQEYLGFKKESSDLMNKIKMEEEYRKKQEYLELTKDRILFEINSYQDYIDYLLNKKS